MARSIWTIILLAVVASVAFIAIGIHFSSNGNAAIGNQMIGAGATVFGSAIVGLSVAKVSATLSGQIQQEIEARREHKREIDRLIEYLKKGNPPAYEVGNLNWLVDSLLVQSRILKNLENLLRVDGNEGYQILWDDLENHWREVKCKADQLLNDWTRHNNNVRDFINRVENELRKKSSEFTEGFDLSFVPNSRESKKIIDNRCFAYVSIKLAEQAMYIIGQDKTKRETKVDPSELEMYIPEILEWALQHPETYANHSDEFPPLIRDLPRLGKEKSIEEYRKRLAYFLQKIISESIDELNGNTELVRLVESKSKMEDEIKKLEKDLQEIKISKSLTGSCKNVRVR